jgi:lysophospholipase L1-like esterase
MGLDGLFRDLTYSSHFPAIYFNSLVESRLGFRTEANRRKFAEVINARGYPAYKNGAQAAVMGGASDNTPFAPLPLQKSFFEMTLAMLDRAGIDTYFMITPFSQTGAHAHDPRYQEAYLEFVRRVGSQYRHFHLLQRQVPVWPNSLFADGVHLNENGADVFSQQLDDCIKEPGVQNEPHAACEFESSRRAVKTANANVHNKAAS